MTGLNYWNGNSVIARHDQAEKLERTAVCPCGSKESHIELWCSEEGKPCHNSCEYFMGDLPWWKWLMYLFGIKKNAPMPDCEFSREAEVCECGREVK